MFQALRFSVAAAFLALLYRSEGLRFRSHWRGSLVVGFCLTAGYLFQSAALLRTSASRTAFLTALCVPLTPLFECILVTRTLPSRAVVLSIALAVAGTYLLTAGSGSDGSWGTGDWLMIGCACFFAFHFLALNHFGREPGAFKTLAVGQCAVGTLLSWAVIPLDLPPFVRPSAYLYGGVLATGIFATGGAFALLSWAQQHVSASRTAIICAVEPLFAALAAFMVLGEGLSSAACGGGALIVAAVVASEVRCDVSGPPPSWLPAPAARLWLAAGAIQQRCTGPAVVPAAVESGATDVR